MHPEVYHEGWLKPPFFEGWYFKLVDRGCKNAYAIIPGAFRKGKREDSRAFILVLDGNSGNVRVFNFPYDALVVKPGSFDVMIGTNHFSRQRLTLDLVESLSYSSNRSSSTLTTRYSPSGERISSPSVPTAMIRSPVVGVKTAS